MPVILVKILVVLSVALFCSGLRAEEAYRFTLGTTTKELSFNYYHNTGNNDAGRDPAGVMTAGMYSTYFLRFGSPYQLLETNKKSGYYFEGGLSPFAMNLQTVGEALEEKDLGTRVSGNYAYLTPVFFYVFGDLPEGKNQWSMVAGVGVGLGYLDVKGNIRLTEDGSNRLLELDEQGWDLAVSILYEVYYGNWVWRTFGGGPSLTRGNADYSLFDFSMDLGYVFRF